MKYLYVMTFIFLLSSCGNNEVINNNGSEGIDKINKLEKVEEVKKEKKVEKVEDINDSILSNEINQGLTSLESENLNRDENKVVKIDATFNNTDKDVDMMISYSIDGLGKIKTINVEATNFDLSDFDKEIQNLIVGKTLKEASEIDFTIGGASITTEAFKRALKD